MEKRISRPKLLEDELVLGDSACLVAEDVIYFDKVIEHVDVIQFAADNIVYYRLLFVNHFDIALEQPEPVNGLNDRDEASDFEWKHQIIQQEVAHH